MPGKILGLDISEDAIAAVQIKSGLKGYQVMACSHIMVDGEDGLDDALERLSEQMPIRSDTYKVSIPGEHASYRNLQMPFREQKKIRQTLPFEIETLVPFQMEDLVVDFSVFNRSDQSEILAVSVNKTTVAGYLETLKTW